MKPRSVLLASADNTIREKVIDVLNTEQDAGLLITEDGRNWQGVLTRLREEQPEVLMVEMGPVLTRLGEALREVKAVTPQTKIVALHTDPDPDTILAALRSGAHEFVYLPFDRSLRPALDRIRSLENVSNSPRQGKVFGFLSAKGGCGATTLACHIAADLHRQTKRKTLLADMDLASGMVGFTMKAQPTYSVVDALHNLDRLDESLWRALVVESKPGLDIVPAPQNRLHLPPLDGRELVELVRFMRTQHDWVVLDLGRSLNEITVDIYEELNSLLIVSVLEVTALHGLKTIVRELTERGNNLDRVQLVINRTPKIMDMTTDELAKILGRPLFAMLPNDYPSLYQAYSSGSLLPPENRLAQQFSSLTAKLVGAPVSTKKKKFRLFS
jgi:pilus assembly protein CpaE